MSATSDECGAQAQAMSADRWRLELSGRAATYLITDLERTELVERLVHDPA